MINYACILHIKQFHRVARSFTQSFSEFILRETLDFFRGTLCYTFERVSQSFTQSFSEFILIWFVETQNHGGAFPKVLFLRETPDFLRGTCGIHLKGFHRVSLSFTQSFSEFYFSLRLRIFSVALCVINFKWLHRVAHTIKTHLKHQVKIFRQADENNLLIFAPF